MKRRSSQPPRPDVVRRVRIAAVLGLAAVVGGAGAATAPAEPPPAPAAATRAICDSTTALTVIGMDTEAGRVLIAVAAPGGGTGSWIVVLDSAGAAGTTGAGTEGAAGGSVVREAHAWPEQPGGRVGGSVGPGPVLALQPCGANCLQPVRFDGGHWQPLGEPLNLPSASTAAATYDSSGAPGWWRTPAPTRRAW